MSDIKTRTMEEAFYLQTKAFLEKNSEHIAEIARLKAEMTDLKSTADQSKAEVERLTKAGDAMVEELVGRYFGKRLINDWNAAKEGKKS